MVDGSTNETGDRLQAGLELRAVWPVTDDLLVPSVFGEPSSFDDMPRVLATAYLVALVERTCVDGLAQHLDWPREQTVGIHVDLSHSAPTPPGRSLTVTATLREVDGRRLRFDVVATDDAGEVSRGTHDRAIIDAAAFTERLDA